MTQTLTKSDMHLGKKVRLAPQYVRTPQDRSAVFEVIKVNPRKVKLREVGGLRILNADPECLIADTADDAVATEFSIPEVFDLGEIVRVPNGANSGKWHYTRDQLFVVIKQGVDRVNIAKLGGEGGRYWRMDPSSLVRVPADSIKVWSE